MSDAVRVVDIAREKDVVWLSLATTVAAIAFAGWLIYRKDRQTDAATNALMEVAKAMTSVASEFRELRQDWQDRPCFTQHTQHNQYKGRAHVK